MQFYDVIATRRSIRAYRDQSVADDVLLRILEAVRLAPSAANRQPWHWYVIRDATLRRQLFPTERHAWVAAAPVIVVGCSQPNDAWVRSYDGKNHADIDVAIAMEHLVLAATAEGLGSCWICAFDPLPIRQVLGLPDQQVPVAITPLGYPAGDPGARIRKAFDEIISWR